jgi:hypothetical protein
MRQRQRKQVSKSLILLYKWGAHPVLDAPFLRVKQIQTSYILITAPFFENGMNL